MREIIYLTLLAGGAFLLFIVFLVLGIARKSKNLKIISLICFFGFILVAGRACYSFVTKSYASVTDTFKPRTGDQIYDALFDNRLTNCVKVIHHQDQVIPKIDYAIWLHFTTCPAELNRILARHVFSTEKVPTKGLGANVPYGETWDWFNPAAMGDTVTVHEYTSKDGRNIQTIWVSPDGMEVYCRDIFD